MQSCATTHKLWEMLLSTYGKKEIATKIYQIWHLYTLQKKESDSIRAHLIAYPHSQLPSQGMTIEDELRALIFLSSLPPSWETFVTTICNASTTAMTYASATGSIISGDGRRK